MPLRSLLQGILFLLTNKWILSYLLQGSVSVCPLETYPLWDTGGGLLLPAAQDRGHDAGAAVCVHDGNDP